MKKASPSLQRKQRSVVSLKEIYSGTGNWFFIFDYKSLGAVRFSALRRALKVVGASVVVVKNRINKVALGDTAFDNISAALSGQMATVCGANPVEIVKILKASQDDGGVKMVAASDGHSLYDVKSLTVLASLPSLEVLHAKLLGVLVFGTTKLLNTLLEPCRSLMRVCDSSVKRVV